MIKFRKAAVVILTALLLTTLVNIYVTVEKVSAQDDFSVDLTKKYMDFSGAPIDDSSKYIAFNLKNAEQQSGWGVLRTESLIEGKTMGDLLEVSISGTLHTASKWNELKTIENIFSFKSAIIISFSSEKFNVANIDYIKILSGFASVDGNGWGIDTPGTAGDIVIKNDVTLWLNHNTEYYELGLKGVSESGNAGINDLSVRTVPDKTEYKTDETFNPCGMTLNAVIYDGTTLAIDVTQQMCSYDFSAAGKLFVTVSYGGGTVLQSVNVINAQREISGIEPKNGYYITLEQFTDKLTVSEESMLIIDYDDNSREEIPISVEMISSFNNENEGVTEAQIKYLSFSCKAEITVTAFSEETFLKEIKYGSDCNYGKNKFAFSFDSELGENTTCPAFEKTPSAVTGKTLGDLILVGEKTVNELISGNKIVHIDIIDGLTVIEFISENFYTESLSEKFSILPGFQLITNDSDNSSYSLIPKTILSKRINFTSVYGKISRLIESVTLADSDYKTEYKKGENIEFTNLFINVKYDDIAEKSKIAVTSQMVKYDFSEAGFQTVTVSYGLFTVAFKATVTDKTITALKINRLPDKTIYDWGSEEKLDMSGMEIAAVIHDNYAGTDAEKALNNTDLTFSGFDCSVCGVQNVKISYGDLSVGFEITVEDISKDKHACLLPYDNVSFSEEFYITYGFSGIEAELLSKINITLLKNVADKIYFNGSRADTLINSEVNGKNLLSGIYLNGNKIIFDFENPLLQPSDKSPLFISGKSMLINEIALEAGLQFYCSGEGGKILPVSYGILKENIILENLNGNGWQRELKRDENGNTAAEAVYFIPPAKLVYNIGEIFDCKDSYINLKYEDGGETKVTLKAEDFTGFDSAEAGDFLIGCDYDGVNVYFVITVKNIEIASDSNNAKESLSESGNTHVSSLGCNATIEEKNIIIYSLVIISFTAAIFINRKKNTI